MALPVHILGGHQTDFARKWSTSTSDPTRAMLAEVVQGALENAGLEPNDVEVAHVGNFLSETFSGQAHLGALIPELYPAWQSLPAARHEGACASGSLAVLAAMADIESGRYDAALVVGIELMRNVAGQEAAHHLGAAACISSELDGETLPWPGLFDRIATEVDKRFGLDREHLSAIARINRENAKRNPLAQTRDWRTSSEQFSRTDMEANPVVVGETLASDCGRITDGASAVVLAGPRFVERLRRDSRRDSSAGSVIQGWGHHCASLPLEAKLAQSESSPYLFPSVRQTALDAYRRAGIPGAEALDVVELHDCFTITEYVLLEHLGIATPGEAWRAIEDGAIAFDGKLPVNPSGGLIGAGHPVGATGVRMLLDAHRQVTGQAGEYQVPDTRLAATLNIGGSCSTSASFVVGTAVPKA